MDSGEVIPCLNEDWSFAGAKLMEWMSGLMTAFMVSTAYDKPAHVMPLLVLVWIGTTLVLAVTRKRFPDEERGVRNMVMASCGFAPPGIPAPARIQPLWSGMPMRELSQNCLYEQLRLDEVLFRPKDEDPRR
jgi:hypothetical protein